VCVGPQCTELKVKAKIGFTPKRLLHRITEIIMRLGEVCTLLSLMISSHVCVRVRSRMSFVWRWRVMSVRIKPTCIVWLHATSNDTISVVLAL